MTDVKGDDLPGHETRVGPIYKNITEVPRAEHEYILSSGNAEALVSAGLIRSESAVWYQESIPEFNFTSDVKGYRINMRELAAHPSLQESTVMREVLTALLSEMKPQPLENVIKIHSESIARMKRTRGTSSLAVRTYVPDVKSRVKHLVMNARAAQGFLRSVEPNISSENNELKLQVEESIQKSLPEHGQHLRDLISRATTNGLQSGISTGTTPLKT